MRYLGAALVVMLASTVQLAACASRVTSLSPDKTFSALSAEERRQYCEDQFHYMSTRVSDEDMKKINCATAAGTIARSGGADTERARAACRQAYQACMSLPPPQRQSSCETFSTDAERCAATVGDATKCAEARADELEKVASKADTTCNDLGRSLKSDQDQASKTEACTRVQQICPTLYTTLFGEPAPTGRRR